MATRPAKNKVDERMIVILTLKREKETVSREMFRL